MNRALLLLCGALLTLGAGRASATLGERAASIDADRKALAARAPAVTIGAAYSVHELRKGAVRIREYVSAAGVVFAVAWDGPVPPDLGAVLGAYAGERREAERATGHQPGRRARVVRSANLTIARWGHMGRLQGRVLLDAIVPAEVSGDEIQ